jgi:hypothetical protein
MITLYLVIGCNNQDGEEEYEVYSDHTDECECIDALHEASLVYDRVMKKTIQIEKFGKTT